MTRITGTILTKDGWIAGTIALEAGRVTSMDGRPTGTPEAPYILPGFVDLHVHGGGGADMMSGAGAIRQAARLHRSHGTTTLLATSVTAPLDETETFLGAVAGVVEAPGEGEARVLGAHLEGPFINPKKLGAQPPYAIPANVDLMETWLEKAPVRVVTYAPEMDPDDQLRDLLLERQVKPQIGHSICGYARAAACIQDGCGATHLFNAMTGLSHRGNGIAGAVLAQAEHAEMIFDLIHVEQGALLAARRAVPKLYGVTDATAGAGAPDGDYSLGSTEARKSGDRMVMEDGTLAGSVLTMDAALRNLVSIGIDLAEAARRLSEYPAEWVGEADIGHLSLGARGDIVVLDADLSVTSALVGGEAA